MNKKELIDKVEQIKELVDEAGASDIYCGNRDSSSDINLLTVAVYELTNVVREMINRIE